MKENMCAFDSELNAPVCIAFVNFAPRMDECKYYVEEEVGFKCAHAARRTDTIESDCECREAVEEMMVMYRLETL